MSAQSKHRDRQFFLARGVFGLAAAILVALVVFIAVRSGGSASADENPVIVQPSADLQAAESTTVPLPGESTTVTVTPSPSGSASASASASASTSASKSVSAGPSKSLAAPSPSKTSASPKPSASPSTAPPASNDLIVSCKTSSWPGGFITSATVRNNGGQNHNFQVTIGYSSNVKITSGPWNSSAVNSSGSQIRLKGNKAVDAHGTVMIGFQGSGDGNNPGCSVAVVAG